MAQTSHLLARSNPHAAAQDAARAGELLELVARAATSEGETGNPLFPGLLFLRISNPSSFRTWQAFGPSLAVVAQGQKISSYRGVDFTYDPSRYLVVTGEAEFEGKVVEATPERPFLAFCYSIPPDVIAKMLLTLAHEKVEPVAETVPAFVGTVDRPILDCAVRLLRALEEPLERRVVAPLAVEELVFRLLRSDAAAAVRSAVGQPPDTDKIQLAMQFLRSNVERSVSVDDVARHVAMSPSHFAHRFRAVARVSPMRYLKQLRLHHARTLMVAEGLRVGEAAARAGYESTSHFTRDFRGLFGTSPGEYARHFRDS
ncbi:AraC family transcriptional regulator [Labilithrix luteola]|uniref:AraC family transcriptional regulator n=1 Tax=Labilithrix luteola TaxID=1391654 RepID=UPI00147424E7|nr:AraC family transcriptional regulator [Labilithrix luteola]